ncbi:MAG: tetratricopeptide repeat protein [Gemmatimonadota bacterium]|nr:tetratricopeptide repeat protein [Gemmatimonadota bacterium]
MKLASRTRTLAFHILVTALFSTPTAAQVDCPRASGPDAEAGWEAYSANNMAGARARFRAALSTCPDDQYARTGVGYVDLREGDTQAALSAFGTVIGVQPNNVDALTGLGLASWRLGDLDAVEAYFSRVAQLVPDHPTALEYLGRISAPGVGGDPDPAAEAWVEGNTARALELYLDRLASNPNDEVATLRVGLVRAWQGDYRSSLDLLNGLVQRNPGHLDARLARARVHAWSGDIAQARNEALEILAVDPDHPDALEALALFQSWAGDVEEALASYDELISISPQNRSAGRQRAQALAWSSRFEASRAAYDALLARDPDDLAARLGLARTLAYGRNFDESVAEYDRILASEPANLQALIGKGRTLGWAGRLVEGERVAQQAVSENPANAEAWAGLGQLFRWQGRTAAAKGALETAAGLAPTNAEVLDQLRSVNLTLAPVVRPTVVYEDDSDGNRMITTRLAGSWHPTPRLDVWGEGYFKDLKQGIFLRKARGGAVRGSYQLEPGWRLSAGLGGSVTDGTASPSLFEYRAGVSSPERYPFVGAIEVTSIGLNETAVLAEIGARSTDVVLTGHWTPNPEWRVDGSLGVGEYNGTEANGRRSGALSTSRRVGRFFSVGASVRGFSFEKNLDDGYFDPDFYGIGELTGYWLYRPGPWTLLVELAPGAEKVRSDGSWGATVRSNARAAYRLGPGREVSLAFGYSSAGLVSFASTAANYRYTTVVLGSSWVF